MPQSVDVTDGDVFGVLGRNIPARLVEISRSGCLLESAHRVTTGTVGELRLEIDGELVVDDVRVTRCVLVEGSGASYLVGAEFVQTRRPGVQSIRRAVGGILRGAARQESASPVRKTSKQGKNGAAAVAAAPNGNNVSPGEDVMKALLARFVREDEGQDIIEYALLAGLITTGVVATVTLVGTRVLNLFTALKTAIGA